MLSPQRLHSCLTCGLASQHLFITKKFEFKDDKVSDSFSVTCGCKQTPAFGSQVEVTDAWNLANAPKL